VGVGVDMGRALADLIKGVDQLIKLARVDESLAVFREAPENIKDLARNGKCLPQEIYEVAHRIARGTWPEDIDPGFKAAGDQAFTASIKEGVPC
jgi:hypothetical protein